MALIASLFAIIAAISAAATISVDSSEAPVRRMAPSSDERDEERDVRPDAPEPVDAPEAADAPEPAEKAPVRRVAKERDEAAEDAPVRRDAPEPATNVPAPEAANVPASLGQVTSDGLEEVAADDEPVSSLETMSLHALHKDWPRCQVLRDANWGGVQGKAQHLKKMNIVFNVSSAQACGALCGSYGQGSEDVPCAGWAWVAKTWATEFSGFKSCAMFGFVQNDVGAVRFPVSEYTYKNHCCSSGTPCKDGELISEYAPSADKVARAYRKAERARRGREKMERAAAATAAKIEAAKPHIVTSHVVFIAMASVLALGVIGGVYVWKSSYEKQ